MAFLIHYANLSFFQLSYFLFFIIFLVMNEVFFICSIVKFTKLRLIDLKEEDKEEEEMSSSGGSGGGTPQKDNGIRRLWNKMGGAVEQTKMAPDFVKSVENYDTYKESVDLLVDRLEIAVQQNPNILANVSYKFYFSER